MDLISTLSITDLVATISVGWFFGYVSALIFASFKSNPISQAIINTTLAVLEKTEVVWSPIVNASLIVLKPVGSMALVVLKPIAHFALEILKPAGPLVRVVLDNTLKALVVFGYVTAMVVIEIAQFLQTCVRTLRDFGGNVSLVVQNTYQVTKDFVFSFATIIKGISYIALRTIQGVGYILTSFEKVSDFLYNMLFGTHTISWSDIVDIALPFLVVASILGYAAWRISKTIPRPSAPFAPHKKWDAEIQTDKEAVRRSIRIAKKRAMITCEDLCSTPSSGRKASTFTTDF